MEINLDFHNKIAVVTGGSRGIGLGCAEALVERGAKVAIIGRQPGNVAKATKQLQKKGVVKGYQLDVRDVSAIGPTFERIRKDLGEIDVMVCSAGVDLGPTPADTITEEQWDSLHSVNIKGTFFCIQAAGRQSMIPRKTGAIVVIASVVGVIGAPNCIGYNTSKAAVVQMVRSVAVEWAQHNIRVNAVAPSWTLTDMAKFVLAYPEFEKAEMAKIPLHRWAKVEDVVPAVIFLASNHSGMITGDTLLIDGGWAAH
ncbi:MAG TPA: SDR family oxidoreductase [Dehalococcoidales bacterium]|nr:SDR family oxidoreductase [Dehalococcoidales bacterium]